MSNSNSTPPLSPSSNQSKKTTRREVLRATTVAAAATALAGVNIPHVFAAEDNTIRLALVGCGGRGGGAIVNALNTNAGPVKLVALADVFEDRVKAVYDNLQEEHKAKLDVPKDRMFV